MIVPTREPEPAGDSADPSNKAAAGILCNGIPMDGEASSATFRRNLHLLHKVPLQHIPRNLY
jgi:hypothetical protein